ncbi:MAG: hypothetical protein H7A51_17350 [Akkermansiaceae bacterium]|nr:hypothetical protein [Akkermansiaceae bacterium]
MRLFLPFLLSLFAMQTNSARSWQDDVIYFIITDRFYDGDPTNNSPAGAAKGLVDPKQENIDLYHGGDFRGIELALTHNYFTNLGITAIWITPPVKNVWNTSYDSDDRGKTGYHGYWTQDFMDIDPHLTSTTKIDGTPYPEGREGRLQHYRDLLNLAHRKGIRVIQDIVCNHAGPVFYYDANNNRQFDRFGKREWIAPYKENGYHANTRWANIPQWNVQRTGPTGPLEVWGKTIPFNGILGQLHTYGRKGFNHDSLGKNNGEEVDCDFFSLRDIYTHPQGDHYREIVDEFIRIYAFYINDIGVDGLRIDTVKHVHHQFWTDFCQGLRKAIGKRSRQTLVFGEIYDGSPEMLGKYTYPSQGSGVCLDGTLNFQMCWAIRNYMRHGGGDYGHANGIERAMHDLYASPKNGTRPYYNPVPGPGGLNARQQSITFVENHDGLNRFRVDSVSSRRNTLANALVLTLEGIPCLYYGTEDSLLDPHGKIGQDSETGRLTFIKAKDGRRVEHIQSGATYTATRSLIQARRHLPALRHGLTAPLWVDNREASDDDGTFLFARYIPGKPGQTILVGFNLSGQEHTLHPTLIDGDQQPLFPPDTVLERVPLPGLDPDGTARTTASLQARDKIALSLPADSVSIWRVKTTTLTTPAEESFPLRPSSHPLP